MDNIEIAKVLKPQGIKGEIKAQAFLNERDVHFLTKEKFLLINNRKYEIEYCSFRLGYLYIKLKGVDNRDAAEQLRDGIISFPRDQMPPLDVNEFYTDDLIGCTLLDEKGKKIGRIVDINDYGASSILVIKNDTEEILCPFLLDLFTEIDLEYARLTVNSKKFDEVTKYED